LTARAEGMTLGDMLQEYSEGLQRHENHPTEDAWRDAMEWTLDEIRQEFLNIEQKKDER